MDKKEFIFPGVVLVLVLVIAIGLLLTQGRQTTPPIGNLSAATSSDSAASSRASSKPYEHPTPGTIANYYPYGRTILLIGQVAGFQDGLSIRPISVREDSRCPEGVQCIQAGTVNISLRSSMRNQSALTSLSVGQSVVLNGTKVTFESVEPAHPKDAAPAESAYRLTFSIFPETDVVVSPAHPVSPSGQCYIGGCSSEICSNTPGQVSSCIYREQYACYKGANCERQSDGQCGWTQTAQLKKCIATAS